VALTARAITNNFPIKIAAVILALILWAFAKGEQQGIRLTDVPLVLRNIPEGVTTVEQIPETVQIVLSGPNKEILKLEVIGDTYAFIDMADAEPGRALRVSLSPADVVLPQNAGVYVLEVRSPKSLDLDIDRLVERSVRVTATAEGELPKGYFILGAPQSMPDSVVVYGPASVVADLSTVSTAPLNIAGRRARVEAARPIVFDGTSNLHAVPRDVRVTVEIEGTRTVTVEGLPVTFLHEPGLSATIEPTVYEAQVTGPEHRVHNIGPDDITAVVDARGLPRGVHELVPDLTTPEGVAIEQVTPVRFTVTLSSGSATKASQSARPSYSTVLP